MNPEVDANHQKAINNISNFRKRLQQQRQQEQEQKEEEQQQQKNGLKWKYLYEKSLEENVKEIDIAKIEKEICSSTRGYAFMKEKVPENAETNEPKEIPKVAKKVFATETSRKYILCPDESVQILRSVNIRHFEIPEAERYCGLIVGGPEHARIQEEDDEQWISAIRKQEEETRVWKKAHQKLV